MPWWNPSSSSSSNSTNFPVDNPSFRDFQPPLAGSGGSTDPFGGFDSESYETASDPGLFGSLWNGFKDTVDAGAERLGGVLDTTVDTVYNWGRDTTHEVRENIDQFTDLIEETYEQGTSWLGAQADDAVSQLTTVRDRAANAIETFGDRSMDAILFTKDVAEAQWDHDVKSWQTMFETAEQHSQDLQDEMASMINCRTEAMRSIWNTGVEFVQAAQKTGDIVVDAAFASEGVLTEELINQTIERVDSNLKRTEGGKLFSSALDAGVWLRNVADGAEYTVHSIRSEDSQAAGAGTDWSAMGDAVVENETNALMWRGPIGYMSDRSVRLFEGLSNSAGEIVQTMDTAIDDARQLQGEYEMWRAEGNERWQAAFLTAVGDDDFVSRTEAARNLSKREDPEHSNLVTIQRDSEGQYDPNSALMFTGILNESDKALMNVEEARTFAQRYRGEDVSIDLVYNPTHSMVYDLAQVQLVNKFDLIDRTTRAGIEELRTKLNDDDRDKTRPVQVFAHSQGAAIASAVLSHLTEKELAQIEVTSFGGAAYRYPEGLRTVEAIVNNQDIVPSLFGAGIPFLDESEGYEDPNYNVLYIDIGDAGNWANSHNMANYVIAYEHAGTTRWEAAVRRFLLEGRHQ